MLILGMACGARSQIPKNGSQPKQPAQIKNDQVPSPSPPCFCSVQVQNVPPKQAPEPDKKPSWYPWREIYAPANIPSWFLVGVGIFAGWLALRTLGAIRRQVDTFTSKERGRLTVEVESFDPGDPNEVWYANLLIANHGSTNVFIGPALCLPCINAAHWNMKDVVLQLQIDLPKVIPPNVDGIKFAAPIQMGNKLNWSYDFLTIDAIGDGTKGVFVTGQIEYWDVFDTHWSLKFCRKWGGSYSNGSWWFTKWRDYGPKEGGPTDGNDEYKIEDPSKMRRLWLWIRRRDPNTLTITKAN
jgi:hypothetical protein